MKHKSLSVQRNLPRPTDMNQNIMRPADMLPQLNEYQLAEEMIKEEMLIMLHHDALYNPTLNQCGLPIGVKKPANFSMKPANADRHEDYLNKKDYERFTLEELNDVRLI
jgi:pre-mRNA-splicing factor CDC5/CEF1